MSIKTISSLLNSQNVVPVDEFLEELTPRFHLKNTHSRQVELFEIFNELRQGWIVEDNVFNFLDALLKKGIKLDEKLHVGKERFNFFSDKKSLKKWFETVKTQESYTGFFVGDENISFGFTLFSKLCSIGLSSSKLTDFFISSGTPLVDNSGGAGILNVLLNNFEYSEIHRLFLKNSIVKEDLIIPLSGLLSVSLSSETNSIQFVEMVKKLVEFDVVDESISKTFYLTKDRHKTMALLLLCRAFSIEKILEENPEFSPWQLMRDPDFHEGAMKVILENEEYTNPEHAKNLNQFVGGSFFKELILSDGRFEAAMNYAHVFGICKEDVDEILSHFLKINDREGVLKFLFSSEVVSLYNMEEKFNPLFTIRSHRVLRELVDNLDFMLSDEMRFNVKGESALVALLVRSVFFNIDYINDVKVHEVIEKALKKVSLDEHYDGFTLRDVAGFFKQKMSMFNETTVNIDNVDSVNGLRLSLISTSTSNVVIGKIRAKKNGGEEPHYPSKKWVEKILNKNQPLSEIETERFYSTLLSLHKTDLAAPYSCHYGVNASGSDSILTAYLDPMIWRIPVSSTVSEEYCTKILNEIDLEHVVKLHSSNGSHKILTSILNGNDFSSAHTLVALLFQSLSKRMAFTGEVKISNIEVDFLRLFSELSDAKKYDVFLEMLSLKSKDYLGVFSSMFLDGEYSQIKVFESESIPLKKLEVLVKEKIEPMLLESSDSLFNANFGKIPKIYNQRLIENKVVLNNSPKIPLYNRL